MFALIYKGGAGKAWDLIGRKSGCHKGEKRSWVDVAYTRRSSSERSRMLNGMWPGWSSGIESIHFRENERPLRKERPSVVIGCFVPIHYTPEMRGIKFSEQQ